MTKSSPLLLDRDNNITNIAEINFEFSYTFPLVFKDSMLINIIECTYHVKNYFHFELIYFLNTTIIIAINNRKCLQSKPGKDTKGIKIQK